MHRHPNKVFHSLFVRCVTLDLTVKTVQMNLNVPNQAVISPVVISVTGMLTIQVESEGRCLTRG